MANTFVLMGRPGSGKGTQAKLLAEKLGCEFFSAGQELRELAKEDSVFGRKIGETLAAGDLVPHWLPSFLFESKLMKLKRNQPIVCDGFGRTESEAETLIDICEWLGRDLLALHLNVSEETTVARIEKRRKTEGRSDDGSVKNRLERFNKETLLAIEHLHSLGKVLEIDGEPTEEAIADEIWQKIQTQ